jgi:hypothetical protein
MTWFRCPGLLAAVLLAGCSEKPQEKKTAAAAQPAPAPVASPPSDEQRMKNTVIPWLEDMKKGDRATWRFARLPSAKYGAPLYGSEVSFHALRSYEILSVSVAQKMEKVWLDDGLTKLGTVTIRVEASDSAGRPIIKTYKVRVGLDAERSYLLGVV